MDFGAPPPYYLAAPDMPSQPPPQPQIVDRQAYWQQQQQLRQEALQRAEQIRNHFMQLNQMGMERQQQLDQEANFAAGLPQGEANFGQTISDPITNTVRQRTPLVTDQGNNPLPAVAGAFNTLLNPISEGAQWLGEHQYGRLPNAGLPGVGGGNLSPVTTPEEREQLGTIYGLAAPAVADVATGGALALPYAAQGVANIANITSMYVQGQISGRDALIQIGLTAPQALPIVLHGVGKLSEFARSAEGQRVMNDVARFASSERGGGPPEQSRFTSDGEIVSEPLLQGDKGQQGDLLGLPAQTGEGLSGAGPMFEEPAKIPEVGSGFLPPTTDHPYFDQPPPDYHELPGRPAQELQLRRDQIEVQLASNPMADHTGAVRSVNRFTKRTGAAYGGAKATSRLVDQIAVDDSTYSKLKSYKESRGLPFNAEEAKDANGNHSGWWVEYEDQLHGLDSLMPVGVSPSVDQLHDAIALKAELKDVNAQLRGNPDEHMTSTDAAHALRDQYHLLYLDILNNPADPETAQIWGDVATAYEEAMAAVRKGDLNMPLSARQLLGLPDRARIDLNAEAAKTAEYINKPPAQRPTAPRADQGRPPATAPRQPEVASAPLAPEQPPQSLGNAEAPPPVEPPRTATAGGGEEPPRPPDITSLTKPEQARVSLGKVPDVFAIAQRYEAGSPQRQALIAAVTPLIAHLPEADQKFIRSSIDALPSKASRDAATAAQRARQASGADAAFRGEGTTQERAIRSYKAMGGKQPQQFTPIGGRFTPAETSDLFSRIDDAYASGRLTHPAEAANATSALTLLMTGERLPTVISEGTKPLNLMPHEIQLLGRIFGPEFEAAIPRTPSHLSGFHRFIDVLNLPRAIITAIDISAAGRQGILLAARNPVEFAKSFPAMARAMRSEEGFARAALNLRENAKFEDALSHGLEFTNIGGGVGAEEPFVSSFASRIPGVAASERGFTMFLDNLRMLSYEKYANRVEGLAGNKSWAIERTDLAKRQVARFLNHASGRGSVGALGEYTPAMNAVFFSPRFFVSRPQSIWDMVRPDATPIARQIAFENVGAFVGLGVGMLATAKAFGASVEIDPRSSDFGRMKFGNTRIDFWGGYQPLARYIAQMASAHVKNPSTGVTGFVNPGDTALRFFRSKLSPAGATIYDYLPGKQKDYQGNDLIIPFSDLTANKGLNKDAGALAWNTFATKILPLSIQDAISGFQASGWKGSLAAGGVSALGGGVSSYEPTEKQQQTVVKNKLSDELDQAGFPTRERNYEQQSFRDALSHSFDVQDMPRTYDEFRTNWIDQQVKAGVARSEAIRRFNLNPLVKGLDSQIEKATLGFWKAHPDLLQRAIDSGTTDSSAEKQKILADAHH